jgi:hypothetical protein
MATRVEHAETARVNPSLERALQRELQDGETIAWMGMKVPRVDRGAFAIYFFAIPWTGFALFWMTMAGLFSSAAGGDWIGMIFPLFGLPFVLVGLAMLAMPFVSYMQRGRILFAVTDSRVLQLNLGRDLEVVSVPASRIRDIVRRESADGSGSVDVTKNNTVADYTSGRGGRLTVGPVEDVMGAYRAILVLSERP